MENAINSLGTLIGSLGLIGGALILIIKKVIEEQFKPINVNNELLNQKMDKKDYNDCKRYLTDFITDVKNGVKKSEIQIKMATETYDHYHRPKEQGGLGGNTWVEDNWNKLKEEGKI